MLELIEEENSSTFDQLVQDYEAEFSSLTGKLKNQEGKYPLDTDWRAPYIGYYWKEGEKRIGFCIKSSLNDYSDIAEFYVSPPFRGRNVGRDMAFALFDKHQGVWQVRQILHNSRLRKSFGDKPSTPTQAGIMKNLR